MPIFYRIINPLLNYHFKKLFFPHDTQCTMRQSVFSDSRASFPHLCDYALFFTIRPCALFDLTAAVRLFPVRFSMSSHSHFMAFCLISAWKPFALFDIISRIDRFIALVHFKMQMIWTFKLKHSAVTDFSDDCSLYDHFAQLN